ncbi:hypothetical protein [Providencia sp. PROV002]|uniref:hypothetical protein n=1 Tax=unclassified Providencia TaxID=2633465 RepID=UPI00386CB8D0
MGQPRKANANRQSISCGITCERASRSRAALWRPTRALENAVMRSWYMTPMTRARTARSQQGDISRNLNRPTVKTGVGSNMPSPRMAVATIAAGHGICTKVMGHVPASAITLAAIRSIGAMTTATSRYKSMTKLCGNSHKTHELSTFS